MDRVKECLGRWVSGALDASVSQSMMKVELTYYHQMADGNRASSLHVEGADPGECHAPYQFFTDYCRHIPAAITPTQWQFKPDVFYYRWAERDI